MLRWIVFSGKLFGGLAPLLLIVTVPRVRAARRLPLRVLRIAGRFRGRGSTLVRLDRRLGGRLLFGGCPTLLPAPVVRLDRRLGGRLLFAGCPTLPPAPVVRLDPRLGGRSVFGGGPTLLPAAVVRLDLRLGGRLLFGGCPTLLPVPVVRLGPRLGGRLLFGGCPTLLPVPVVRLVPRLGAGLLFGGCPTPLPAPIVGVFPICVVFPLTWLIRHDDSSLAEAGGLLPPKVSGSLRHLKRPETTATAPRTPLPPSLLSPPRRRRNHATVCRHIGNKVRSMPHSTKRASPDVRRISGSSELRLVRVYVEE